MRWIVFGILSLGALAVGFDRDLAKKFFLVLSIPVISLIWIFWWKEAVSCLREVKFWVGENKKYLLAFFVIALFLFWKFEPRFRILTDELVLSAVSRGIFTSFRPEFSVQSYRDSLGVVMGETRIPTRPIFFPFVAAHIHFLFGYRPENLFFLNFIAVFGLFVCCFALFKKIAHFEKNGFGTIGGLCVISIPGFLLHATTAGFDVFHVFWISLGLLIAIAGSLNFLFLHLLLLCHCRYESIIIALPLFLARLYQEKQLPKTMPLAPLALAPLLWQRAIFQDFIRAPFGGVPFSLERFVNHFRDFIALHWTAICALIVFLLGVRYLKARLNARTFKDHRVWLIAGLLHFGLVLSFYGGRPEHASQLRLFLPFFFLGMISLLAEVSQWRIPRLNIRIVLGITGALAAMQISKASAVWNREPLNIAREFLILKQIFDKQENRNFLVVHDLPILFSAFEMAAVCTEHFSNYEQQFYDYVRRGRYSEIFHVTKVKRKLPAGWTQVGTWEITENQALFVNRFGPPE